MVPICVHSYQLQSNCEESGDRWTYILNLLIYHLEFVITHKWNSTQLSCSVNFNFVSEFVLLINLGGHVSLRNKLPLLNIIL